MLLGCSGSVATVKLPEMVVALHKAGYEVRVVLSSDAAIHFFIMSYDRDRASWKEFMDIGGYGLVLSDRDEWSDWRKVGDPVLHIELRKWADVFVMAPASANTLAKCKLGLCDSLLLSVYRAWDFDNKPVICAPAMNTLMLANLNKQMTTEYGMTRQADVRVGGDTVGGEYTDNFSGAQMVIIDDEEKELACGDVGKGAMASVDKICKTVAVKLSATGAPTAAATAAATAVGGDESTSITHPTLQSGWVRKYTWNPFLRVKYFWRYSRFCSLYRTQILYFSVIVTSVATGIGVVWLMKEYGQWQFMRELDEHKSKMVEKFRTKADHYASKLPESLAGKARQYAEKAALKAESQRIPKMAVSMENE